LFLSWACCDAAPQDTKKPLSSSFPNVNPIGLLHVIVKGTGKARLGTVMHKNIAMAGGHILLDE